MVNFFEGRCVMGHFVAGVSFCDIVILVYLALEYYIPGFLHNGTLSKLKFAHCCLFVENMKTARQNVFQNFLNYSLLTVACWERI